MKFNNNDEEEKADFFETVEEVQEKPKEPKLKPDDPNYWYRDESRWEHLMPKRPKPIMIWSILSLLCVGILIAVYVILFVPYAKDATEYGYVESIRQEGSLFKTYEGVLIPYKSVMDTTRVYLHDFEFTAKSEQLAVKLKKMQLKAQPVRLQYYEYHIPLPWRGKSKIVVTAVDSVDPRNILPPEFTPEYYRSGAFKRDTAEVSVIKNRTENRLSEY